MLRWSQIVDEGDARGVAYGPVFAVRRPAFGGYIKPLRCTRDRAFDGALRAASLRLLESRRAARYLHGLGEGGLSSRGVRVGETAKGLGSGMRSAATVSSIGTNTNMVGQ